MDLTVPICLRMAAIRRALGYAEVTAPEEALTATVEAERSEAARGL